VVLSLVLGISILLQFTAAFLALRLIRVTGRRTAWAFIAAAVSLMALRRCITLFGLISGGLPRPPDLLAELVALGTSALMVVGMAQIAPFFLSIKHSEEALRQRNRELALLNRAGRAFSTTLDLDQVLATILEEMCSLLDVVAGSVWLIDLATDELVCRQAVGPQSEIVHRWRLAPGQGLAGWVAHSGESLIVPDVQADERHFKEVDRQTGLGLRSILSVPLRAEQNVIGVLQVMDIEADRFSPTDLGLLEPLAATAAIAIRNARLYEQAQHRMESLTNLNRTSQVITSSLDMEEVLEQIVELAGSVVNSDYTSVVLVDEEGKPARETEHFTGMPPISQRIRGRGVTRLVIGSGQAVVVDAISGEGEMSPPVRWSNGELMKANPVAVTAGIHSFAAVPIRARGRAMGIL